MKSSISCLDLAGGQRPRPRLGVVGGADGRLADQVGRRADAGVVQLDRDDRALRLDRRRQAREALQMVVRKDARAGRGTPGPRLHMGGAGHHQAKAALGAMVSQWNSSSDSARRGGSGSWSAAPA